jgi:hypothetical protein
MLFPAAFQLTFSIWMATQRKTNIQDMKWQSCIAQLQRQETVLSLRPFLYMILVNTLTINLLFGHKLINLKNMQKRAHEI